MFTPSLTTETLFVNEWMRARVEPDQDPGSVARLWPAAEASRHQRHPVVVDRRPGRRQRATLELSSIAGSAHVASLCRSGARFTKYLTTILRFSYDNAKVTIDLRRTSNLRKHPTKGARLFLGTIHLQTCKIVLDSVYKLAYDIPKRNFGTF